MADEVQLSPHDAAMAAKVDEASAALAPAKPSASAVVTAPQRPEHIPEKFWDAEKGVVKTDDLAKSYAELEKARVKPPEPQKPAEGSPEAAAAKAAEDAAKAAGADTTKVDFAALSTEFSANGNLSEDSYKKLESAGLGKDLVDQFIAGQQAILERSVSEAQGLAGGAEKYTSMLKWAGANLSAADQAAFDRSVLGDPSSRKQAIVALKSQYDTAVGSDPSLVAGSGQSQGGEGAFQSRAQVTAAMRDPRYRKDAAYRAEVERRVGLMESF